MKELSGEQRIAVINAYAEGLKIREITERTGVRSRKTVYYILRCAGIEPCRKRKGEERRRLEKMNGALLTIVMDEPTQKIIEQIKPGNLSEFVCDCIKRFLPKNRK